MKCIFSICLFTTTFHYHFLSSITQRNIFSITIFVAFGLRIFNQVIYYNFQFSFSNFNNLMQHFFELRFASFFIYKSCQSSIGKSKFRFSKQLSVTFRQQALLRLGDFDLSKGRNEDRKKKFPKPKSQQLRLLAVSNGLRYLFSFSNPLYFSTSICFHFPKPEISIIKIEHSNQIFSLVDQVEQKQSVF